MRRSLRPVPRTGRASCAARPAWPHARERFFSCAWSPWSMPRVAFGDQELLQEGALQWREITNFVLVVDREQPQLRSCRPPVIDDSQATAPALSASLVQQANLPQAT